MSSYRFSFASKLTVVLSPFQRWATKRTTSRRRSWCRRATPAPFRGTTPQPCSSASPTRGESPEQLRKAQLLLSLFVALELKNECCGARVYCDQRPCFLSSEASLRGNRLNRISNRVCTKYFALKRNHGAKCMDKYPGTVLQSRVLPDRRACEPLERDLRSVRWYRTHCGPVSAQTESFVSVGEKVMSFEKVYSTHWSL